MLDGMHKNRNFVHCTFFFTERGSTVGINTSDFTAGDAIGRALKSYVHAATWQWLLTQVATIGTDPKPTAVARVFALLPRQLKSGDKPDTPSVISFDKAVEGPNGLSLIVREWSLVRLARVWVLMAIPKVAEADYVQLIEQLFSYGEMEELVALYAALPVYHHPEAWRSRCKEGIRSNIGPVRRAVMVDNPYPERFLDEAAWNQLVLKAFFTDEAISRIIGLRQRNNRRLAQSLTDYAYERHAAHREINPMLWILVGPFMDERTFNLMERVIKESGQPLEQRAIAYAFKHSNHSPAHQYIEENDLPAALSDHRNTPWEAWR